MNGFLLLGYFVTSGRRGDAGKTSKQYKRVTR